MPNAEDKQPESARSPMRTDPERTERLLAVLDEYASKLRSELDVQETHRQRFRTVMAAAMTAVAVGGAAVASAMKQEGRDEVWGVVVALPIVAALVAYGFGEWTRYSRSREDSSTIARRLSPLVEQLIGIHDRVEKDDVRRELINLRMTEARLGIARVEELAGTKRAIE